jgi:hypothetical protein
MTHDELLAEIDSAELGWYYGWMKDSLRAVVELHRPIIHALPDETCWACQDLYPCPTIQAIEKELG